MGSVKLINAYIRYNTWKGRSVMNKKIFRLKLMIVNINSCFYRMILRLQKNFKKPFILIVQ
ncbi:hypothetical protein Hdeb2414_s0013g00409591 [Helianthus debilis subsp. tardiflorus]